MTTTLNLKYGGLDMYNHPVFTTHNTDNQEKSERKLTKMYSKMSQFERSPIYKSNEHGVCKLTLRDLGEKNMIVGGMYSVSFDFKVVDGKYVNAWLKSKPKLLKKPDNGKALDPAFFDDSEDDDE
jgi:hypothetical protein